MSDDDDSDKRVVTIHRVYIYTLLYMFNACAILIRRTDFSKCAKKLKKKERRNEMPVNDIDNLIKFVWRAKILQNTLMKNSNGCCRYYLSTR